MKILKFETRKTQIVAFAIDSDADMLQRFPNEKTTLRDIDGYGNDYEMCADEIKVIPVDDAEVSTLLKYGYLIENHEELIFYFLAKLQNLVDAEDLP